MARLKKRSALSAAAAAAFLLTVAVVRRTEELESSERYVRNFISHVKSGKSVEAVVRSSDPGEDSIFFLETNKNNGGFSGRLQVKMHRPSHSNYFIANPIFSIPKSAPSRAPPGGIRTSGQALGEQCSRHSLNGKGLFSLLGDGLRGRRLPNREVARAPRGRVSQPRPGQGGLQPTSPGESSPSFSFLFSFS